eukprot:6248561-Pyramimonas_sp.AAC.1
MLPALQAGEGGDVPGNCVTGAWLSTGGEVKPSRLQWRDSRCSACSRPRRSRASAAPYGPSP